MRSLHAAFGVALLTSLGLGTLACRADDASNTGGSGSPASGTSLGGSAGMAGSTGIGGTGSGVGGSAGASSAGSESAGGGAGASSVGGAGAGGMAGGGGSGGVGGDWPCAACANQPPCELGDSCGGPGDCEGQGGDQTAYACTCSADGKFDKCTLYNYGASLPSLPSCEPGAACYGASWYLCGQDGGPNECHCTDGNYALCKPLDPTVCPAEAPAAGDPCPTFGVYCPYCPQSFACTSPNKTWVAAEPWGVGSAGAAGAAGTTSCEGGTSGAGGSSSSAGEAGAGG